ncbi:MAG: hypothetical protein LBQ20_05280 [Rhodanobacter sp.]|nr:hypothetical protein [Rhodanobacter sp.]
MSSPRDPSRAQAEGSGLLVKTHSKKPVEDSDKESVLFLTWVMMKGGRWLLMNHFQGD